MIDYDLTIKNFFKNVDDYLTGCLKKSYDTLEYDAIVQNLRKIRNIAQKPRVHTQRSALVNNLSLKFDASGFIRAGSQNGDVYQAFIDTIAAISNYYAGGTAPTMQVRQELLYAIKNWARTTSPNVFKDIIYFFTPAQSFAAHVAMKHTK